MTNGTNDSAEGMNFLLRGFLGGIVIAVIFISITNKKIATPIVFGAAMFTIGGLKGVEWFLGLISLLVGMVIAGLVILQITGRLGF